MIDVRAQLCWYLFWDEKDLKDRIPLPLEQLVRNRGGFGSNGGRKHGSWRENAVKLLGCAFQAWDVISITLKTSVFHFVRENEIDVEQLLRKARPCATGVAECLREMTSKWSKGSSFAQKLGLRRITRLWKSSDIHQNIYFHISVDGAAFPAAN